MLYCKFDNFQEFFFFFFRDFTNALKGFIHYCVEILAEIINLWWLSEKQLWLAASLTGHTRGECLSQVIQYYPSSLFHCGVTVDLIPHGVSIGKTYKLALVVLLCYVQSDFLVWCRYLISICVTFIRAAREKCHYFVSKLVLVWSRDLKWKGKKSFRKTWKRISKNLYDLWNC